MQLTYTLSLAVCAPLRAQPLLPAWVRHAALLLATRPVLATLGGTGYGERARQHFVREVWAVPGARPRLGCLSHGTGTGAREPVLLLLLLARSMLRAAALPCTCAAADSKSDSNSDSKSDIRYTGERGCPPQH